MDHKGKGYQQIKKIIKKRLKEKSDNTTILNPQEFKMMNWKIPKDIVGEKSAKDDI